MADGPVTDIPFVVRGLQQDVTQLKYIIRVMADALNLMVVQDLLADKDRLMVVRKPGESRLDV